MSRGVVGYKKRSHISVFGLQTLRLTPADVAAEVGRPQDKYRQLSEKPQILHAERYTRVNLRPQETDQKHKDLENQAQRQDISSAWQQEYQP
jgi:hypothetical protein